ncbi:methylated-DNA--[protein]-cysteine S-methyltransferase [Cupriavidus oxalaticus]|jgi:methylated-DNA-[protein]-cysteine S-methyltransferase|uniref:Methylated-DNA--protein-cysteine methyltransferase n=1 Tax=Cupriavidus oxalaticus TaxID=96344 RepID=A0A375GKM9_9BURK|nr:methylated-DNA--[protein]-cysteine S-methyltransferase [Cupriavidus oxalaticus]QEZ44028.1 methylated-DNA--[protein]-cysteine S-methyltransferase [Cupriavidus oxalaticus]QRQ84563.1 methylated-DNA--[protein]-cysteine S-methyltransferase [Cupriavidus oxalaticus]QRQ91348.1 methylated-DNA--[protein]-cysteine S-methyltransferase [Cupriavidus oxalaticus]WQD85907.1 methylated-DNA--[protein]-cysteine S-methyltransferase [Cupriavidus oxalaticus]SPC19853.1 Methylated-DNA--protein-cysteine methyltransf
MSSYRHIDSPLGTMLLRAEGTCLTGVFFAGQKYYPANVANVAAGSGEAAPQEAAVLERAAQELAEYFAGKRDAFTVPVRFAGSPFQQRVWQALQAIPCGATASYGELAGALGLPPTHARAVGGAVGRNPLSVIVPCHRVLGTAGALTGYAGGIERKRALLRREGVGPAGG